MPNNTFSIESITDAASNAKAEHASQQDIYNITAESLAVLKDLRAGIDDLNDYISDVRHFKVRPGDSQTKTKSFLNDYNNRYRTSGRKSVKKGFTDAFEEELLESLIGSDFKKDVKASLSKFAKDIDSDLNDLSGSLGKQIAKMSWNSFSKTKLGSSLTNLVDMAKDSATSILDSSLSSLATVLTKEGAGLGDLSKVLLGIKGDVVKEGASLLTATQTTAKELVKNSPVLSKVVESKVGTAISKGAQSAFSWATKSIPHLGVAIAGLALAAKGASVVLSGLKTSWEGVKSLFTTILGSANRYQKSREVMIDSAYKRLVADTETMVKTPFEILSSAAQTLYDTWSNNLATISTSQNYTKSDVQDLISSYAQRLQSEGLAKYISSASITDNLSKVLSSGLSGAVAEEFAYLATVLEAAVPTQDFFSYASTYASIAANAIKQGDSQNAAIQKANDSLATFASGILYASRELSGGFTTGLQDAQSLFEQAAKIAQAGRTGNISDIASVLLAVRGEVGSIAPDLASSITDTIYQTLTGGNSSNLVALRSLAGVNASNTEFLRAVANNPKQVFSAMFSALGSMYNQSPDAYMEKAEGYAQLFGLSSEAFQRIDFNSLASAITSMNMDNTELSDNIKLLLEGQTTTSTEQLKMQQINQFMIDEGLSLVMDNAAAQAIQQHMWDEQMNQQLMENQYSVELAGNSMKAIEQIMSGINSIFKMFRPSAWLQGVENIILTKAAVPAQREDIKQLLNLSKIGKGNAQELYHLTTYGQRLNAVPDLVSMMGGYSKYQAIEDIRNAINSKNNKFLEKHGAYSDGYEAPDGVFKTVTKSTGLYALNALKGLASSTKTILDTARSKISYMMSSSGASIASSSASVVTSALERMLSNDYLVDKFVKQGKSYSAWAATAANFGISDLESALTSVGKSTADIKQYFQEQEAQKAAEDMNAIREHEKLFRDTGISFWSETFFTDYKDPLFSLFEINNQRLESIVQNQVDWKDYFQKEWIEKGWQSYVSIGAGGNGLFNRFYQEFMKYFINHTYYSNTKGYTYEDVEKIQKKSRKQEHGDTVNALAEMLTTNLLDLKDPTMQTNAILSQILIVVSAIMNQNNEVGGKVGQSALLDSLSAMALGLTANSSS